MGLGVGEACPRPVLEASHTVQAPVPAITKGPLPCHLPHCVTLQGKMRNAQCFQGLVWSEPEECRKKRVPVFGKGERPLCPKLGWQPWVCIKPRELATEMHITSSLAGRDGGLTSCLPGHSGHGERKRLLRSLLLLTSGC